MSIRINIEMTLRQGDFLLEVRQSLEARILALFGPSGAGKTTMLDAMAGWRRPDAGEIEVGGRLLYSSSRGVSLPARLRGIGYVPQDVLLFPHLDVRRNILYGAARGNGMALERILNILEIDALLDRSIAGLSGGERQRVAVARALMSSPELLLLDEPLAAVDLPLRRRIVPCLQRVRDELGVPMIYVTHEAAEARTIADRVIVLDRGRVAAAGPPELLDPV